MPNQTTSPAGQRPSVSALEEMKGYFTLGEWDTVRDEDYARALRDGRRTNTYVRMHLKLTADDLERTLGDPKHPMRIEGWIQAPKLWGQATITGGRFGLFVPTENPALKRMEYCFHFDGGDAGPLTLIGFKEVSEYLYTSVMQDSQTLYCRIFRGTVDWDEADTASIYAVGVLNLHWWDFIKYDVFGMRFGGPDRVKWGWRFIKFFVGSNSRFQFMKITGRHD